MQTYAISGNTQKYVNYKKKIKKFKNTQNYAKIC